MNKENKKILNFLKRAGATCSKKKGDNENYYFTNNEYSFIGSLYTVAVSNRIANIKKPYKYAQEFKSIPEHRQDKVMELIDGSNYKRMFKFTKKGLLKKLKNNTVKMYEEDDLIFFKTFTFNKFKPCFKVNYFKLEFLEYLKKLDFETIKVYIKADDYYSVILFDTGLEKLVVAPFMTGNELPKFVSIF